MFKEMRVLIVDVAVALAIVVLYSPNLLALRPTDPNILKAGASIVFTLLLLDIFVYENIVRHIFKSKKKSKPINNSRDAVSALKNVDSQQVFYTTISDTKEQLQRMQRNGDMIKSLLTDRFTEGSLTYDKFYSAFESAQEAILTNTRNIMTRMELFDAKSYLRLKNLIETNAYKHDNIPDDLQLDQYELYTKNMNQIKDLVGLNEELLVKIESLGMEIATIDTNDSTSTDQLIQQIEQLIEDIKYYK